MKLRHHVFASVLTAAAVAGAISGLYYTSKYVVQHGETAMPTPKDPGLVLEPGHVANGDLVVHHNRTYEVRVEPLYDTNGGYQGANAELWSPGEVGSQPQAPFTLTWWALGNKPDKVRVIGRAK